MSRAAQRRACNSANRAISSQSSWLASVTSGLTSAQPCGCDPGAGWTCERHRVAEHTHYVRAFASAAICGAPALSHSLTPSCPECQALIANEATA